MAVYMTMDLPVARADIEAVSTAMGVRDNPPKGLIAHVCIDRDEGVRVIDMWDSRADFEAFRETLLNPTLGKVMAERGVQLDGPPPEPEFTDAWDVVRGGA